MDFSAADRKRMRPIAYRALAIGAILLAAQLAGPGSIPTGPSRPYVLAGALAIMALMPVVLWPDWSWHSKAGGAVLAVWVAMRAWWPDLMPEMQSALMCTALGAFALGMYHEKWRQVFKALAEAPGESAPAPNE